MFVVSLRLYPSGEMTDNKGINIDHQLLPMALYILPQKKF